MTAKYWMKIVLAMSVIFILGLFVSRGVNKASSFIEATVPSSLPLLSAGFRFDGDRVGGVERLQLMRSHPKLVDSAVVTVKLDEGMPPTQFDGCRLTVADAKHFNRHTSFTCASEADVTALSLVQFGHVNFQPGNKQVTLWIPQTALADFQHDAYTGNGASDSGDVDILSKDGNLSITVNGREIVRMSGDSNGGSFVVRDGNGHPIVEISGNDSGGSVKVSDGNGKKIVDINGKGRSGRRGPQ